MNTASDFSLLTTRMSNEGKRNFCKHLHGITP